MYCCITGVLSGVCLACKVKALELYGKLKLCTFGDRVSRTEIMADLFSYREVSCASGYVYKSCALDIFVGSCNCNLVGSGYGCCVVLSYGRSSNGGNNIAKGDGLFDSEHMACGQAGDICVFAIFKSDCCLTADEVDLFCGYFAVRINMIIVVFRICCAACIGDHKLKVIGAADCSLGDLDSSCGGNNDTSVVAKNCADIVFVGIIYINEGNI